MHTGHTLLSVIQLESVVLNRTCSVHIVVILSEAAHFALSHTAQEIAILIFNAKIYRG